MLTGWNRSFLFNSSCWTASLQKLRTVRMGWRKALGPVPKAHTWAKNTSRDTFALAVIVTVKLRPLKGTQRTNGEPIIEQRKETKSHVFDPRVSLPHLACISVWSGHNRKQLVEEKVPTWGQHPWLAKRCVCRGCLGIVTVYVCRGCVWV